MTESQLPAAAAAATQKIGTVSLARENILAISMLRMFVESIKFLWFQYLFNLHPSLTYSPFEPHYSSFRIGFLVSCRLPLSLSRSDVHSSLSEHLLNGLRQRGKPSRKKNENEFISPFPLIASFFSLCSISPHSCVIFIHVVKYTQHIYTAAAPLGRAVLNMWMDGLRSRYLLVYVSCAPLVFFGIIPSTWVSWRNKVINYRKAFPLCSQQLSSPSPQSFFFSIFHSHLLLASPSSAAAQRESWNFSADEIFVSAFPFSLFSAQINFRNFIFIFTNLFQFSFPITHPRSSRSATQRWNHREWTL